ncbi:MAG: filamentous hemagglutinin N-terminal domain-containing protein [Prochloraceae cyanobacterium]|nr:filamentous hemagglutinin N-terminal domain-containing protein [Prochloraceae cyanobacterium]
MFEAKYPQFFLALIAICVFSLPAKSQIIPDRTLGREGSRVVRNQRIGGIRRDRIDGGARRGNALFHSFREFNVRNGRGVYFTNPRGVRNIFNRVTGNNLSRISGTLGVLGNANLFLINPNGIIFGQGAKLDIGGSFTATTAPSLNFNGLEFSATAPGNIPTEINILPAFGFDRITFNVNEKSGDISVKGTGNNILDPAAPFEPFIIGSKDSQLEVLPEKNINFISRNINLNGGNLVTPAGTTNLYAVRSGKVFLSIDSSFNRWLFTTGTNAQLGNILANNRSSVDASGTRDLGGGSIKAVAEVLTLLDGSAFVIENTTNLPSDDIKLNVKNIFLSGIARNPEVRSSLLVQNFGNAKSPEILIKADNLRMANSALITSSSYSTANPGNISVIAENSIEIIGFAPLLGFESLTGIAGLFHSKYL